MHRVNRTNRENGEKKSVRENIGELEILPKHGKNRGNLVCSSCKFPDSKGKRYFIFAKIISNFSS